MEPAPLAPSLPGMPAAIANAGERSQQHLYHGRRRLFRRHPHTAFAMPRRCGWLIWPRWSTGARRSMSTPADREAHHLPCAADVRQPAGGECGRRLDWRRPPGGQRSPGARCCRHMRLGWKTLRLVLVNRHADRTLACHVILDGRPLDGGYASTVLCGDAPEAYNDINSPQTGQTGGARPRLQRRDRSLPPHTS